MTNRFHKFISNDGDMVCVTDSQGKFTGEIVIHPYRLSIPLKRRKPTVWAIWNDWAHAVVPFDFQKAMIHVAMAEPQHIILALTKRPGNAAEFFEKSEIMPPPNWWNGLTVCNQDEADAKIPVFLQVPGKKFLSIEPMLGAVDLNNLWAGGCGDCDPCCGLPGMKPNPKQCYAPERITCFYPGGIDAVILGGETGPGARPLHPDWVRSVRDQCAAAGTDFFFKGWGEWQPIEPMADDFPTCGYPADGMKTYPQRDWDDYRYSIRVGRKKAGRFLDGRTHDELPWRIA